MATDDAPPSENPLADGSARAWNRLIETVGPASLLVVIESRMGAALRAKTSPDDVLQDVLMEAWASRAEFEWRGVQPFRSWLLTLIDRRLADTADHFAALKRGGVGIGAAAGEGRGAGMSRVAGEPVVTTTPSRLAMYREQAAVMSAAIAAVPEDCREIVRLRLFDELQSGEIAVRLGIGESAVRHRFRRGVEVYRKALARLLSSRSCQTDESARGPGADSAPGNG